MKKLIWLSYDLGLKGDYTNLYAWLDSHRARECGDSIAVLSYTFRHDVIEELKDALEKNISPTKQDRIYVIWRDGTKIRGKFLFGTRKAPPWTGYGAQETTEDKEV